MFFEDADDAVDAGTLFLAGLDVLVDLQRHERSDVRAGELLRDIAGRGVHRKIDVAPVPVLLPRGNPFSGCIQVDERLRLERALGPSLRVRVRREQNDVWRADRRTPWREEIDGRVEVGLQVDAHAASPA